MDILVALFGAGKELDSLQMALRAALAFVCTLALIRISGRRSFGQRSPFDYVVAILLGATLSRFIVGASPAVATFVASLVLVLMHRALAWLCVRYRWLETLVVGVEREVYRDGTFNRAQMSAALITRTDVLETVRQELHATQLEDVEAAILERNGEISLIRRRSASP
ncbi:DUF421 domain-containing protein [Paraburkholderia sp. CNPSo 3281]|uniref:DUF421 domain-containing protein n=1 Tax=Paraburkholderia sp. CNPSo 3281 TaxID=2940933 RepID=UPI0020B8B4E0|nr:YetF domain-containing protein [Paraburkholderia sp. CNPSo 3281]MCP3716428.1 DUF421 domain-containing protein [Paraburkholderia sp. CNPSo 3281]